MSFDSQSDAEEFKAVIEEKIRLIVAEFADGKISREQFHILYERYNSRLAIANHAILSGNPDAIQIARGGPPTLAVRGAYMGKAMGVLVYHHRSDSVLETLGNFAVETIRFLPRLAQMTIDMSAGKLVERRVEKINDRHWLIFTPGRFTTAVMLFRNEPAQLQVREIERLHHDFEQANRLLLDAEDIDGDQLAYPFLVFVQKWSKK